MNYVARINGKKYELAIDEFQKDDISVNGSSKKAELRRLDSKNLHSLTVILFCVASIYPDGYIYDLLHAEAEKYYGE